MEYIGKYAEIDPKGIFRIVSKDKGFDPLIKHLQAAPYIKNRYREEDALVDEVFAGLVSAGLFVLDGAKIKYQDSRGTPSLPN